MLRMRINVRIRVSCTLTYLMTCICTTENTDIQWGLLHFAQYWNLFINKDFINFLCDICLTVDPKNEWVYFL